MVDHAPIRTARKTRLSFVIYNDFTTRGDFRGPGLAGFAMAVFFFSWTMHNRESRAGLVVALIVGPRIR